MENHEHKICPMTWLSGFFGLGALVHFARLLFQVPVTLGTFEIPMALSAAVTIVFGGLSLALLFVAMKRPCCKEKTGS